MTFKFYYKLKNNLLPNYFNNSCSGKITSSQLYPIEIPNINYQFSNMNMQNTLRCELIKNLNIANTSETYQGVLDKLESPSLYGYSLYIKKIFLNNYEFECVLLDCFICRHINAL